MKKYSVEFIGTFFLTFVATMSGDAVAVAAVLIAMIYAGAHVSGAHYNPAVTLAFWVAKKISLSDLSSYLLAQFTAALVALKLSVFLLGECKNPIPVSATLVPAFIGELLFSFALVFVVLNAALAKKNEGNQFYGLAIGLVVLAGIISVGKISGAFFNPAIVLAYVLTPCSNAPISFLLGYILMAVLAAFASVQLFNYSVKEENE